MGRNNGVGSVRFIGHPFHMLNIMTGLLTIVLLFGVFCGYCLKWSLDGDFLTDAKLKAHDASAYRSMAERRSDQNFRRMIFCVAILLLAVFGVAFFLDYQNGLILGGAMFIWGRPVPIDFNWRKTVKQDHLEPVFCVETGLNLNPMTGSITLEVWCASGPTDVLSVELIVDERTDLTEPFTGLCVDTGESVTIVAPWDCDIEQVRP